MLARALIAAILLALGSCASDHMESRDVVDAFKEGDYGAAVPVIERLAERGEADAQNFLGVMYDTGQGLTLDHLEAARWYRRAAEQGDADAQYNLATLYESGDGVARDEAEAAYWYRDAAEQGHDDAQFYLGALYESGKGVKRDYVESHKWFDLAALQNRENAAKARDAVAERMTRAQIKAAKRRASDWQSKRRPASQSSLPDTQSVASYPARVAQIQAQLTSLDYDAGPIDGIWGPKTRHAVRLFQKHERLSVTGRVSESLETALLTAAGFPATMDGPRRFEITATGSGYFVSRKGHVLTNAHVVSDCQKIYVSPSLRAGVLAVDKFSDLALLKTYTERTNAASMFRQGPDVRVGDDVFVSGYPLQSEMATQMNFSAGSVRTVDGPGGDRRLFDISAQVHPGNSGGPVLDRSGNAIGVVLTNLGAVRIAGDVARDAVYATNAGVVRTFLDALHVPYETAPSKIKLTPIQAAIKSHAFTVAVECRRWPHKTD